MVGLLVKEDEDEEEDNKEEEEEEEEDKDKELVGFRLSNATLRGATRPERPKGAKDEVKEAPRAAD